MFSPLRSLLLLCLPLLLAPLAASQQSKVLAPHIPVAPKVKNPPNSNQPPTRQSMIGGLWMTDSNMKAALYLKNGVKTDSLVVTPILYLSNGVRYSLPAVALEPSGTAIVDINQGLANQGVAPYAKLYGYAEIEYQWPWAGVSASIRNVDPVNSLIFIYALQQPPDALPQNGLPMGSPASHDFEGLWWKQEKDVSGFLGLANLSGQAINATVRVTDNEDAQLGSYQVTVSPHGTKMLNLSELKLATGKAGGIYVTHDGPEHGLAINGALVDEAVGYSANLWVLPLSQASSSTQPPSEISFAELGLMTGAADPMMNFPSGTMFTPYSVVRNISEQPASVTPTLWWMAGGVARSAQLPLVNIAPHRTLTLKVPALIAATGLKNFNGSVNLVLDTKAESGALVLAAGSVDQTNTYVFQVTPRGVGESASQALCYWSTGNGDDTMVTLWNAADEEQDLVFTLFFSGGHYAFPMQLPPRATRTFNISEILHGSLPDAEGNIVPAGLFEGSAEIAGSQGENEHILVSIDAGIYNVRKAICGSPCIACNGVVDSFIVDSPFAVAVSSTKQQNFYMKWNTGSQYNLNGQSRWSSTATSVATVSAGLVSGISPGAPTISAQDNRIEPAYNPCPTSSCSLRSSGIVPSGQAPGKVQKPTYLYATGMSPTTNNCELGTPFAGQAGSVHYQVLDQTGTQMTVAGMTPKEQLTVNGKVVLQYATFATPTTTAADGLFDDKPVGACFSSIPPVGSDFCTTITQNFQVLYNNITYPITTTATQLQCYHGVRVSATGNPTTPPPDKNFTYTLGSP